MHAVPAGEVSVASQRGSRSVLPLGASVLAVLALLALIFRFSGVSVGTFFKNIAAPEAASVSFPNPIPSATPLPEHPVILASFADLFSSNGWIDTAQTTMYRDGRMTAYLFPPKWDSAPAARDAAALAYPPLDLDSSACIDGRCLTVMKSTELFFSGSGENRHVPLPPSVNPAELTHLSVGALDTGWLVGAVTKTGAREFQGSIFIFDGSALTEVPGVSKILSGSYDGIIGFGGIMGDWVAVLGGYEGRAVRVRGGAVSQDLSSFLNIPVMSGGFAPDVTRVPVEEDLNWYVTSRTPGVPVFWKFYGRANEPIRGAVEFGQFIIGDGNASFRIAPLGSDASSGAVQFSVRRGEGADARYLTFRDFGFDTTGGSRVVVSSNVVRGAERVISGSIGFVEGWLPDGQVSLSLSPDGRRWTSVAVGEETDFGGAPGPGLYWQAQFSAPEDKWLSPFLQMLHVDYHLPPAA